MRFLIYSMEWPRSLQRQKLKLRMFVMALSYIDGGDLIWCRRICQGSYAAAWI